MIRKYIGFIAFVILLLTVFVPVGPVSSAPMSISNAYDVVAAVNQLRASNGLPALQMDGALMASAQAHSEYQASIGTWTHEGADGSRPRDRAAAAGYGGGATIFVSENVAVLNANANLEYLIYTVWSDAVHWNTMVNPQYVHVGAGVAQDAEGWVYYTLDVGYYAGAQTSYTPSAYTPGAPTSAFPSATNANYISPVITATPMPDGSIVHTVENGQAPWAIAIAYGITINDIAQMNGLDPNNLVLWVGQSLVVRPSSTPGPTAEPVTSTPTATSTERATATARPPTRTPTIALTPTNTPRSILPDLPKWEEVNKRSLGIVIISVCALGLVAVVVSGFRPQKK